MGKKEQQTQITNMLDTADSQVTRLQTAFLIAVKALREDIDLTELELALSQNSTELIIGATKIDKLNDLLYGVGISPTGYIFSKELLTTFDMGANAAIANLPPEIQKLVTFDFLGERAVRIMRESGADLVRELSIATQGGVRTALGDSMFLNRPIPDQARGLRQLVGLTDKQMQAVLNFRAQLETRQILGFTPPDERRLNAVEQSMVRRHMNTGYFDQTRIDDMVETYYQRMVNKRALDIARTESLHAVNKGQLELWYQGFDQGLFTDALHRKFWIVTRDEKLRATHAAIPGMNPYGVQIRSMFLTPFGLINSPGDANVNLINCRCCMVLGEVGQSYTQEGYIL
jgi:hypothetical protein